ncbi:MAG TPA: hypothetical protein PKN50_04395 [Spirochaetota bacterium]|nr:hypothetical protein [Spirochaetota bacterium]HPV39752.1 hypothetical protein [Spirochaetota bacterium]
MNIHPDFRDFIKSLQDSNVNFLIVGAYALARHGAPRFTGDLDVWIKPDADNAHALLTALQNFGFSSLKITEEDILSGQTIQLGYPPVRIDLQTKLTGLATDEIWDGKVEGSFGDLTVYYLGKECLIKNKRAIGRNKDLADIDSITQ